MVAFVFFPIIRSTKPRPSKSHSQRPLITLLFFLLFLGVTTKGEEETQNKDEEKKNEDKDEDSTVPDPTTYHYHSEVDGNLVVREYLLHEVHPRAALLCPKGFAITKLRMLLKTGKEILEGNPDLRIPYAHWLVKPLDDGVWSDEDTTTSKCPTLQRCLGYQACLFNFGIEFCHLDPIPGQRKNLNVMVTCLRDERLLADMRNVQYDVEYVNEIARRQQLVLHLTYISRLEEGVPDYSLTEVRGREESEGEVFSGVCVPLEEAGGVGYRGVCTSRPSDHHKVSERLWSLLGRVPSRQCRLEVSQIYCSFLYHHKGLCLPPFVLHPHQASDAALEKLGLSENSMPHNGPRPYPAIVAPTHDPRLTLTPARLGFLILAHKDPPALIQLLRLVYRPQHQYVFHVDRRQTEVRQALTHLISQHFPAAYNIRILPASRSFVASWGSFNIVRAELESFEELLRMGAWDFGVKLSGADMPLRDVDDFSATLAPYRGYNFMPTFGQRNVDMNADQGLVWDVWHGCEGYVYNVTRGGGQPHPEEIRIYTGSQWSVMSRVLVDYAVSHHLRHSSINRYHYHLQTSIIPDESYFPTVTMNSPYANYTKPLQFHFLKKFEGRNTINLCRHMEDTDFCGQGPGPIEEGDLKEIMESSHRYFFARKFHTADPSHHTRTAFETHVRSGYYQEARRQLPRALVRQLISLAHKQLIKQEPTLAHTTPGDLLALRIVPVLHLRDPCCSLPFERSFKSTQEFIYWIDFSIVESSGWRGGSGRGVIGQRAACDCYPDGHLRAMRATTWPEDPGSPRRSGLTINMPFPFAAPGAEAVFLELWYHVGDRSVTEECRRWGGASKGKAMVFGNLDVKETKGDPVKIVAQLLDPDMNVRCEERKTDVWDLQHVHPNRDGERVEMPSFFTLACGTLEPPGRWILRVFQEEVANARHYELPVVVLPPSPPHTRRGEEEEEEDLLMGLWMVEKVALLPLDDYFYGNSSASAHVPRAREHDRDGIGESDERTRMREEEEERRKGRQQDRMQKSTVEETWKRNREEEERRRMRDGGKDTPPHYPSRHRREVDGTHHSNHHHHHHHHKRLNNDPVFSVSEWWTCGGGLLTTALALMFAYHWVLLPGLFAIRPSPRMRRSAVFIFIAILMQIILSACYCR